MRTLFAISTVAFLALLWASISIARHIHRARTRRRRASEALPTPTSLHTFEFDEEPASALTAQPEVIAAAEALLPVRQQEVDREATFIPPPPIPFRRTKPKHPLASLVEPQHRPDWEHFKRDMGDLTDPVPGRAQVRPVLRQPDRKRA